jgi:hypothetical protein
MRSEIFAFRAISDAVAVSTGPTAPGLYTLLTSLEGHALNLLNQGYFTRGAVVRGSLYHDDDMVFGDALLEAYNRENTIARFPRIMISREVVRNIDEYWEQVKEKRNFIRRSQVRGLRERVRHADDGPACRLVKVNPHRAFGDIGCMTG